MTSISHALESLLGAFGDPERELAAIRPDHPDFAHSRIVLAGAGVLAKSTRAFPAIRAALRPLHRRDVRSDAAAHLDAARAWLRGDPIVAAETYAAILARDPLDLLALRLAQSCFFFLGWHDRLSVLVDEVLEHWRGDDPGLPFVHAMAAFAHAENGHAERAEVLGRRALAAHPECPYGIHAVAHALAESGRHLDGARWMRARSRSWSGESRMRGHNAWHLAMFEVESGRFGAAVSVLDDWLLPVAHRSALDACDAVALLHALSLRGLQAGARWKRLSDAFRRVLTPGFWPFVDLHAAIAHAAAGDPNRLRGLRRAVVARSAATSFAALRAKHLTLPGVDSAIAWLDGDLDAAKARYSDLSPLVANVGGSRVQLELFENVGRTAFSARRVGSGQGQPRSRASLSLGVRSRGSKDPRAGAAFARRPGEGRTLA